MTRGRRNERFHGSWLRLFRLLLRAVKMPVKVPIRGSFALLSRIKGALTPDRLPLLIAIDGADSSGKSSLASWLAWQLGMPAVQLDLYLTCLRPIQWRVDDLARVIAQRVDTRRPVIIYGVLVLDALDQIKRKADFLVFVRGGHEGSALAPQIADYQLLQKPSDRANVTIAICRQIQIHIAKAGAAFDPRLKHCDLTFDPRLKHCGR